MKKFKNIFKYVVCLLVVFLILLFSTNVKVDASSNLDNLSTIIGKNFETPSFLSSISIDDSTVNDCVTYFKDYMKVKQGVDDLVCTGYQTEGKKVNDFCLTLWFMDTKKYQIGYFVGNEVMPVSELTRKTAKDSSVLGFIHTEFSETGYTSGFNGSLSVGAGDFFDFLSSHTNVSLESTCNKIQGKETEINISIPISIATEEYNILPNEYKDLYSFEDSIKKYALEVGSYNLYYNYTKTFYYGLKLKLSKTYQLTPKKLNKLKYKKTTLSTYVFSFYHVTNDVELKNGKYSIEKTLKGSDINDGFIYDRGYYMIKKYD